MQMNETNHQKEINVLDIWTIVWHRKFMIIALVTISTVAALVISLLLPKYYKSEAMILAIAPESGGLSAALSASPLVGALAGSIGGLTTPADKILVFLNSRTIANMVIKRFDLLHVFNEDKWDRVKGSWMNPEKPPLMEDVVKRLSKKVTSFRKSKEGTITITVEWRDPKLASDIANYYVTALAEFMKDKSVNTTVQIIDPAIPAEKKSWPIIQLNVVLAGFLSLMVGVVIAMALESRSKQKQS